MATDLRIRLAARLILCAAGLYLHAVGLAQDDQGEAPLIISPPVLIEFTGLDQLAREADRQRLVSLDLEFTLTINPDGIPTDCEFSRNFRRRATEIALCRPLLNTMRFEPAIGTDGRPTTGTYTSSIDFQMWIDRDG